MEIRKFTDIIGVLVTQDIVEGRCVLLTNAGATDANFVLGDDLPGVKLPADSTEAGVAKYVLGWAMDNREMPIYHPYPAYNFIVRNMGFEAGQRSPDADNLPMTSTTVYLTNRSVTQGLTIPSGEKGLAYAGGVFTFPSGHFVHSAGLENVGARVTVTYTAGANRGKPAYDASGNFGVVEQWDATNYAVTIRTLVP